MCAIRVMLAAHVADLAILEEELDSAEHISKFIPQTPDERVRDVGVSSAGTVLAADGTVKDVSGRGGGEQERQGLHQRASDGLDGCRQVFVARCPANDAPLASCDAVICNSASITGHARYLSPSMSSATFSSACLVSASDNAASDALEKAGGTWVDDLGGWVFSSRSGKRSRRRWPIKASPSAARLLQHHRRLRPPSRRPSMPTPRSRSRSTRRQSSSLAIPLT